jgi:subtilisin family serine protease
MKRTALLLTLLLILAAAAPAATQDKISEVLTTRMNSADSGEAIAVWVFFADKDVDDARLAAARAALSERALARRIRNRGADNVVDHYDVPVNAEYVEALRMPGVHIRHESRWLNAVSADVEKSRLGDIAALDFVRRIDVVRTGRRSPLPKPAPDDARRALRSPRSAPGAATLHDYGSSFDQNDIINVIPLHQLGYNGNGVLICSLDAGFNTLDHDAFQFMDIVATRDFVNGDDNVEDQVGQMGTGDHGTYTLSACGGWAPGELIGPAWGASYALAKTENTDWERHIEEDHWVAGAEWADSLGADIITSSLGYRYGFTNGESDYAWTDMDGSTAISTIGADIAGSRGILVITSAGNHGYVNEPQNSIIAPTDGDSVLSVGAVDALGSRSNFSSVGPSADGRIKPDVAAMGTLVRAANPTATDAYTSVNGTSLSCPLVAGAAALLLEANPTLTNVEMMDALRATASQSGAPDRMLGWGIIDAAAAAALTSTDVAQRLTPKKVVLHPAYPNPFNPKTTIAFELSEPVHVNLSVFNVRGQLVRTLIDEPRSAGPWSTGWNGVDRFGSRVSSGVYVYRLTAGEVQRSRKMVLLK